MFIVTKSSSLLLSFCKTTIEINVIVFCRDHRKLDFQNAGTFIDQACHHPVNEDNCTWHTSQALEGTSDFVYSKTKGENEPSSSLSLEPRMFECNEHKVEHIQTTGLAEYHGLVDNSKSQIISTFFDIRNICSYMSSVLLMNLLVNFHFIRFDYLHWCQYSGTDSLFSFFFLLFISHTFEEILSTCFLTKLCFGFNVNTEELLS